MGDDRAAAKLNILAPEKRKQLVMALRQNTSYLLLYRTLLSVRQSSTQKLMQQVMGVHAIRSHTTNELRLHQKFHHAIQVYKQRFLMRRSSCMLQTISSRNTKSKACPQSDPSRPSRAFVQLERPRTQAAAVGLRGCFPVKTSAVRPERKDAALPVGRSIAPPSEAT